jgi:hypothetical protein
MQLIASTELEKAGLPSAEEKAWRVAAAAIANVPPEQWVLSRVDETEKRVLAPEEVSEQMRTRLSYHLLGCSEDGLCGTFDVTETPGTYRVTVLLAEDGESFTSPLPGGPANPGIVAMKPSPAAELVAGVVLLAAIGTVALVLRRKRKRGARA